MKYFDYTTAFYNTLDVFNDTSLIAFLFTIYNSNTMIFKADGEKVQYGTHDELMQTGNVYAKLYNMQAGFYRK